MVAGLPLLTAFFFCFTGMRRAAVILFCFSSLPALAAPFIIPVDLTVEVPWFFMGGRMGLDGTGRVFLCVTAFIWILSSLALRKHYDSVNLHARFYVLFLVAMAGNFGLILARDMLGFYLFFAVMSLSSYGLIVQNGKAGSRHAGIVYLVWVMISEITLFVALVTVAGGSDSLALPATGQYEMGLGTVILFYISFGMKIGAFPLHGWMPLAYQATPAPAAAAMAGAMVNAGLLGFLRFLPLGTSQFPEAALFFVAAGSVSTFYGVTMGLGRRKAGQVLAYSSMSQMGLMTVIFGLGCFSVEAGRLATPVLIIYAVHHGLAKTSLFLGSATSPVRSTTLLVAAGLLLPCLSLAGFPLTSGAVAKTGFKELVVFIGKPWTEAGYLFFPLSSIGTTILMLHCTGSILSDKKGSKHSPARDNYTWILSLAAVAGAIWLWPGARRQAVHSLQAGTVLHSLWPVCLGCLIFYLWKRGSIGKHHFTPLSLHDVFIVGQKGSATGVDDFLHQHTTKYISLIDWAGTRIKFYMGSFTLKGKMALRKYEKVLGRWSGVGFSFVCICLILLFL